jgi:GNAT superfamily N-acetyltransferase
VSLVSVRDDSQAKIRPFDPFRDVGPVAELIGVAFGDMLDPAGRAVLQEMRAVARWGPFLWPLQWSGFGDMGSAPGFVWEEEGRVVGNVSLRRALGCTVHLIGNVAVHPDWQGRGIGRALMEKALEELTRQGAMWAGLEVQADNEAACQLYERLGFKEVGRILHMLRPASPLQLDEPPSHAGLRKGRGRDSAALFSLVCAMVPEPQRSLLEIRSGDYRPDWQRALDLWFERRREAWWVVEEGEDIRGAVRVVCERKRRPDRLEVLVSPGREGRFERVLVHRAMFNLRGLHRRMVEIQIPGPSSSLVTVLESLGFRELRVLVQMQRTMRHRSLTGI